MKKSLPLVALALALVLVFLLAARSSFAAGVTLITHGFEFTGDDPTWVDAMGTAVAARTGPATAVIHLEVGLTNNTLAVIQLTLESGSLPTPASTNSDVVIKLFWSTVAGANNTQNATDIATQTVPYLLSSINWGGQVVTSPFAGLPLHLIGHSRGSSVVTEISRLLGAQGVWVDQVTTLDPHPLTSADVFTTARDPAVVIFDNVIFADNYYETESYPAGESISGTTQLFLNARFQSDPIGGDSTPGTDHTQVHDWYHGTIDLTATNVDGRPIPRAAWYLPGDIGFQYSQLAGGTYDGGTRATNNAGLRFSGATRTTVPRTVTGSNIWDNIAVTSQASNTTLVQGSPLAVNAYFEDTNHDATIQIGFAPNNNPYGTAANPPIFSLPTSATNGPLLHAMLDTSGAVPGTYYIYAKITNSIHQRFSVPNGRVTILQNAGPILQPSVFSTNGIVTLNLIGQIGGTYIIQSSPDLAIWTPIATNTLATTTWQFQQTPPAGSQFFYRAALKVF